jgi:succinate-semialdehyde dehydrogenase/glutarate-semialdehyde dehydrogenase
MLKLREPALLRNKCLVNGEWVAADDGATLIVRNPADGEVVGTVPKMGAAETRRAIDGAHRSFGAWRAQTAKQRTAIMRRWYELMVAHQDDLALILTTEQGKPLAEARGEILFAASFIEWFAEEARRIYGDVIPTVGADRRLVVIKQPIGVCAAITPWNFPAGMICRKAAPALAVGCTMVVKPANYTPLTALAMAVLAEQAGVPAGVLNVVTGQTIAIGAELTSNPKVRKLTFTGSTEVGRELIKQCADTVKKVSMELGGNAPFVVFDDADLDAAVEGALVSKYRNSGQTCVCANRILVQDGVYDAFAARFAAKVGVLKVGRGTDKDVMLGPLIDGAAVTKVEQHINDAVAKGARIVTGGRKHELGGNFFEPTVLTEVSHDMSVAREETFGPVAPLLRFRTEQEAIAMANDTEFGLASYLYSRDIGRVWRVGEQLEAGIVSVNTGLFSIAEAPFGGVKQSGIGREGSKYGAEEYLDIKYLCMGGIA